MKDSKKFVIAAGGTGGHLFPGQALAKHLIGQGHACVLMTDARFAPYSKGFGDIEVRTIPTGRPVGNLIKKAIAAVMILMGIMAAMAHLRQLRPAAVIGFGGYPAYPTIMAAILLRIPTIVHEQNILMGRANRRLAKHISAIATTFPQTEKIAPKDQPKVTVTGNPVRPAVAKLYGQGYQPPEGNDKIHLLVFGGSQGAHLFSHLVPEALALLPENLRQRIGVMQQVRQEDMAEAQANYKNCEVEAELAPFFDDMDAKLAKAHLLIVRAGASTCMELAVAGRPAIYVPLPYAMENHQYLNAKYMEKACAGWVMEQGELTAESLAVQLEKLFTQPKLLTQAADAAHAAARPDATGRLTELVIGVA
jgi:UDP-N-acetylglucosamine--N-acetylmuramyl-(pentapeptide) pyrophosphoryl-undecaprenol N-acetylglucosamine transferase